MSAASRSPPPRRMLLVDLAWSGSCFRPASADSCRTCGMRNVEQADYWNQNGGLVDVAVGFGTATVTGVESAAG